MSSILDPTYLIPPGQETATDLATSRGRWLIDAYLTDQDNLTAVERFTQAHEDIIVPLQGRYYSSLLPSHPPGPGQQLAFEVNLDSCSGCKACVTACHALNGLDDEESWRDVGLIVGGTSRLPVLQHVTTACHHCVDPACLSACPVDAYEKDPITGIVKHLDDQCFGCQYCTLACPYDVPKFHPKKGIVRKCDMCADRLKIGEAPACVQACPHEAIRIRVVDTAEVVARADAGLFLATAPDPSLTKPTTRYLSTRNLGDAVRPADSQRLRPEHAHLPLVIMLVLTQLSVGAFLVELIVRVWGLSHWPTTLVLLGVGIAFGHLGLIASTCHLGRPQFAYRALIGLRHSWLSREIGAFGLFSAFATAHATLSIGWPSWYSRHLILSLTLSTLSVVTGVLGVACSVMVYHVTRRPFWNARLAAPKFGGTTCLLGLSAILLALSCSGSETNILTPLVVGALISITSWKLRREVAFLSHLDGDEDTPHQRSARLLGGTLGAITRLRRALAFVGGILLPLLWLGTGRPMILPVGIVVATLSFLLLIASELSERFLFFAAVVRPKMPGGVTP